MKDSTERPPRKIRLLLLGDASQVHLKRWSEYFSGAGYEVLTISLEGRDKFPGKKLKPPIPRFLPGFLRYPLAVPFVKRAILSFKPDLINAHFLPNYGIIAAWINRKPWILSTWGSDIMLLPEKSFFHMRRTRFVLRRCDFVISDAKVMSKKLVKLSCDPGRILTVPYGVDTETFNCLGRESSSLGPNILSNRKLEKIYNIETILEAFPDIKSSLPNAKLLIVGNGSLRKTLMSKAKDLGEEKDIFFMSEVEHSEVPKLLRSNDIYVSASTSDTTSVSLLEAMACGTFPVVSNIPANQEWIKDGENGLLVPARDPLAIAEAVKKAWNDPGLREKAGNMNREIIAERASWEKNMERVDQLFKKAMKQAHEIRKKPEINPSRPA